MSELLATILAIIIMASAIFTGAYFLDKAACHERSVSFEGIKYTFIGGCMVKHEGKWLPLDNIRGFD